MIPDPIPEELFDFRAIGLDRSDQFFMLAPIGIFNVSAIQRDFDQRPDDFLRVLQPLTTEMVAGVRASHDVDEEYLDTLTAEYVATEAAVAIQLAEGTGIHLIDGTHYILKAAELGETEIRICVVPPDRVDRYRIRFEGCVVPGMWFEIPVEVAVKRMTGIYARRDGTIIDKRDGTRKVVRPKQRGEKR